MKRLISNAAVLTISVATLTATGPRAHRLVLVDLGALPGQTFSSAHLINDRGHIVGMSPVSGDRRAFIWRRREMTDLGTLGGATATATAMNERGQVVGWSLTGSGETHAFLWDEGTMFDLGTLGGPTSTATSINRRGQIVGSSITPSGETHAFLWDEMMIDLGTLGGDFSQAADINDRGQIVGSSRPASSLLAHAFVWDKGVMTDLGTLPGGDSSSALAINRRGQILGQSTSETAPRAVIWDRGIGLGGFGPGFDVSTPIALNRRGQATGWHLPNGADTRGFFWANGVFVEFGTLGGRFSLPRDLNDRGQGGWRELYRQRRPRLRLAGRRDGRPWYAGGHWQRRHGHQQPRPDRRLERRPRRAVDPALTIGPGATTEDMKDESRASRLSRPAPRRTGPFPAVRTGTWPRAGP